MTEVLEGWCTDPYERHEARWMSEGKPTDLVRDGRIESRDPPATGETFKITPVPIKEDSQGGIELRRADDPLRQLSSGEDDITMRDLHPVKWASRWGLAGFLLGLVGALALGVSAAHAVFTAVVIGIFAALGSVRPRFRD